VCRAVAGICDVQETCDGSSVAWQRVGAMTKMPVGAVTKMLQKRRNLYR
jgi:hypothetical protein